MKNREQGSAAITILTIIVVILIGITISIAVSPVSAEDNTGITKLQNTPR